MDRWEPNDLHRPQPPEVRPGKSGEAPSDAILLFNGHDLSAWVDAQGNPPGWKVRDGYFEVVPGAGSIHTRRAFGNCQMHVEWWVPDPPQGDGQNRGNSGVKMMELYEIQVLDSFHNPTYADGLAGAVYAEHPPWVNASLPPGLWQTFDIIFHVPHFDPNGAEQQPATVTVLQNGLVVQDHTMITGPTGVENDNTRPPNKAHPERLPVLLQEHYCTVRFRNVWIRELP